MKVIRKDGQIYEGKFEENEVKDAFRHTTAHILAQAVKRLYPDTKCAIGPAIENGFYYDFEFNFQVSENTLKDIEAEMHKIVKESLPLQQYVMNRAEAIAYMKEQKEDYKVQLIEDLPEDAHIFMMEDQIVEEIQGVVRLIDEVYSKFGFKYHVELSTRPEKSIGQS